MIVLAKTYVNIYNWILRGYLFNSCYIKYIEVNITLGNLKVKFVCRIVNKLIWHNWNIFTLISITNSHNFTAYMVKSIGLNFCWEKPSKEESPLCKLNTSRDMELVVLDQRF